ncbi:MAG: M20 family metallopeptidase [Lentisphaeria bacterium]|nr:M20 family metallopeptidase [Lentisphaeria bacterium]
MISKEMLDLLTSLIKCRPVSNDIAAVNRVHDLIKAFLDKKGVYNHTEEINGRKVLFAATVESKTVDYLFNAHIDVVPAVFEEQYTPRMEGNIMYGRGPGDDLGNAVTLVQTLLRFAGKHVSAGVIFTADEEIGGYTTAEMVSRGYKAKKCIIVVDGGGENIITSEKGMLSVRLIAKGKGGHASAPWAYDNPIEKLFAAYRTLREGWDQPTVDNQWKDSLAVTQVDAGMVHNQIPEQASMVLNIRYIADDRRWKIMEKLRATGLEVQIVEECPPVTSNCDDPQLQRLLKLSAEVRNKPCAFIKMNGATDARHLRTLNVPIAIMGLVNGFSHSAKEFADLSSMEVLTEIFERFVLEE